jgi:hypothetical protein
MGRDFRYQDFLALDGAFGFTTFTFTSATTGIECDFRGRLFPKDPFQILPLLVFTSPFPIISLFNECPIYINLMAFANLGNNK